MLGLQNDPVTTILVRYQELCTAHRNAQENIDRWQINERELMAQISDCFAAARIFEFDLIAEFQRKANNGSQSPEAEAPNSSIPAAMVPIAPVRSEPTIKDMVLWATEREYPKPARATALRHEIGNLGHSLHEKTVGMTLYRLSKEGYVRRVGGRDWYFIPESERGGTSKNLAAPTGTAPPDATLPGL